MLKRKGCLLALIAAAILIVILLAALIYVESRYEAVFRAPRVTHEAYTTGNTAARLMLRPPLAQQNLLKLFVPGREVPDWVLAAAVPEEAAILLDPDLEEGMLGIRVFLNYVRFGPVLRQAINRQGVLETVPGVTWEPPEVVRRERGVLMVEGIAPIPEREARFIAQVWAGARAPEPLRIQGEHLLEAVIENGDGRGAAAVAGIVAADPGLKSSVDMDATLQGMKDLKRIHAFADFQSDDVLAVTVVADAVPGADVEAVKQIKLFIDLAYIGLRLRLQEDYEGVELVGNTKVEGQRVTGEYTLTGVNKLAGALLGTPR